MPPLSSARTPFRGRPNFLGFTWEVLPRNHQPFLVFNMGVSRHKGNKVWCEKSFHVVSNRCFFSEEMVNVDSIYKVGPRKTSYVYVGAHISSR